MLCVCFILSPSHFRLWAFQKIQSPPACSSFCFFSLFLFFIVIQQHFSVRANAFWTASFLPFQARCHCCCLWAGCIYLGVIGVWMSEVMRCIHTWLPPPWEARDRRSLAGLRLERYHTAASSTLARMALSYSGGQTQSLEPIRQWGVCVLKCCVHVCTSARTDVLVLVGGNWKQCSVVFLSLPRVLVCLAACVCRSDSPCVFVSACISDPVAVQRSSRRTFGSHSPLPAPDCPWYPAELPNDVTYTSLIHLLVCGRNHLMLQPSHAICCLITCEIQLHSFAVAKEGGTPWIFLSTCSWSFTTSFLIF